MIKRLFGEVGMSLSLEEKMKELELIRREGQFSSDTQIDGLLHKELSTAVLSVENQTIEKANSEIFSYREIPSPAGAQ